MNFWGLAASVLVSFGMALFFAYLLHWFDRYEREPFLLLCAVFLWGAIVSAGSAFLINTVLGLGVFILTGSEAASNLASSVLIAPFLEEILKGGAVLLVFLVFRNQFDSLMDGILYAGIAALGFAATENAYYIFAYGFQENGWQGFWSLTAIRTLLVGWQHPFYTAFFGIGLAVSRLNRNALIKLGAPLVGLALAIGAHATHNLMADFLPSVGPLPIASVFDWVGWLAMLGFILIVMRIEKHDVVRYLADEIAQGTLTESQYQTAISARKVNQKRFTALFSSRYRTVNQFYRTASRLAIKKKHLARLGEERHNGEIVATLRAETKTLSKTLLETA
jgi:RsiW-degrading membrane proteinase PrsW (M82 family)